LGATREHEIYRVPEGWERSGSISVGPDGTPWVVNDSGRIFRGHYLVLQAGDVTVTIESPAVTRADSVSKEHAEIAQAIRSGDEARALAILDDHMRDAVERLTG
jgi:hypothetical protein